ncbi:MAG TPA: hypothetical protein VFZ61_34340 [Polyangiales bacterium]
MLKKIAVVTALSVAAACGGGGSDEEDTTGADAQVDASGSGADAASNDAGSGSEEAGSADGGSADADTPSADASSDGASADAGDADMDGAAPDATTGDASEDAAQADAGDAAQPDAGPPPFSLLVRRGASGALAQAPVLFHGADGALLSEHTTGADGRLVNATTPAMVTVIAPATGSISGAIAKPQLFTLTQLAAGDEIVLELPPDEPSPAPAPLPGYAVTVANTNPLPANTTLVVAYGGPLSCASELSEPYSPPVALAWPQDCPVQAANTLLAVAYNQISSTNVQPTGYAFAKGVAAFGTTPLAVTLGTWTAPVNTTITLQNAPTSAGSGAEAKLLIYSEGASFDPTGKLAVPFAGTAATRTLTIPTPSGLAVEQSAQVNVAGPLTRQLSSLAVRGAPAASHTLDMATGLAGATSLTINRANKLRAVATWTNAAAPANPADGTALLAEYPGGTVTPWLIVVPGNSATVTFPELPENRRAFLNAAAAPNLYISHFGSSKQQSYRDFLKEPVRPTLENAYHSLGRALTADTSLQAVSYSAQ